MEINQEWKNLLLTEASADPVFLLEKLMALPSCPMHGPVHHVLVGAALLTAYRNAGGKVDLEAALEETQRRGGEVPGGVCGRWGACGAAIATGTFLSVAHGTTPLSGEMWGIGNRLTACALQAIGAVNGPRCCKRDSYLAVLAAVDFVEKHLGISMEKTVPLCCRSFLNRQCIGDKCPFFPRDGGDGR